MAKAFREERKKKERLSIASFPNEKDGYLKIQSLPQTIPNLTQNEATCLMEMKPVFS